MALNLCSNVSDTWNRPLPWLFLHVFAMLLPCFRIEGPRSSRPFAYYFVILVVGVKYGMVNKHGCHQNMTFQVGNSFEWEEFLTPYLGHVL